MPRHTLSAEQRAAFSQLIVLEIGTFMDHVSTTICNTRTRSAALMLLAVVQLTMDIPVHLLTTIRNALLPRPLVLSQMTVLVLGVNMNLASLIKKTKEISASPRALEPDSGEEQSNNNSRKH